MKFKIFFINILVFLILFISGDIIFSNFFYKYNVGYKCYKYSENNSFYELDENCFAKMRLVASIKSYKVYTNDNGQRFSGVNKFRDNNENIFFFGDSQTFGVGSDWEDTFVGYIEENLENYNIFNFGVPSYSPTVYYYKLKKVLNNKKIKPKKIFVVLDLTDVSDESEEWRVSKNNDKPYKETNFNFKKESWMKSFKRENLKGSRLIANYLRETSRSIRKKIINQKDISTEYQPVEGNPSGGYIYTNSSELTGCDNELKKTTFWSCGGVEIGLKKIENNLIKIAKLTQDVNSELYIVTFPWPDTLNYGQTVFNWEMYVKNLCRLSNCKKVINLFPDFINIKNNNNDWLNYLYLKNDIHLTTEGNKIVAEKILNQAFK